MERATYISPQRFNLLDLYQKTFNYVGTPLLSANPQAYIPGNSLIWENNVEGPTNLLGIPYFMPVELDGYYLPNEPIMQLTGGKRIIETPIDDTDGTFKEGFALDDYSIVIQGIAVDEQSGQYPWEIMRKIRSIFEKRSNIRINNELTALFNIDRLVIYDLKLIGEPGAEFYQPYELVCKSDKVYELELKPEEQ